MNFTSLLNIKSTESWLRRSACLNCSDLFSKLSLMTSCGCNFLPSSVLCRHRFVFMGLLLFFGQQPSSICHLIKNWRCLASWRDCSWRWQKGRPSRDQPSSWRKKYYLDFNIFCCSFNSAIKAVFLVLSCFCNINLFSIQSTTVTSYIL